LIAFYLSLIKIKKTFMDTVLAFGMPGGWEWIVIGLFLVVFFGAKKIPEIARGLGKGIREFKDATKDIKQEIEQGAQSDEKKP
jgi:sec-independent protein translocase protein TatA